MSKEIGELVQSCEICAKLRPQNMRETLSPYEKPSGPFQKTDGYGLCWMEAYKQYSVVVDYFSKWIEIFPWRTGRVTEVIENLEKLLAQFSIPETVIADNVFFNSSELKRWARKWGFQPFFRSPEYPQSTGQAEKAVHLAKMLLKKTEEERSDLYLKLLEYRNTSIAGLHLFPAQIIFNQRLLSLFSVLSTF